jgi:hypothetical protein
MSNKNELDKVEQSASQLLPQDQLKLVARISERLSGLAGQGSQVDLPELQRMEAEWVTRELEDFVRLIQRYRALYVTAIFLALGWSLGQVVNTPGGTTIDAFRLRPDVAAIFCIVPLLNVFFVTLMLEAYAQMKSLARYRFILGFALGSGKPPWRWEIWKESEQGSIKYWTAPNLVITFLLIFFSQLKELELFSVPLSQFFSAMSFCICIAVYLLVFDVWRFISDMARDSKGNGIITTTKSNHGHQVQGVFKFSLAASMLLIGIVCILPFYFIFSPYGTVFLIVFAVHAIAAITFWFRYGNDLKHLQVLPWATIKVLAGIVFLLGLVVASIFNKQPSKSFLLGLSTWAGVSIMQLFVTIPLARLIHSIKRAGWKDRQHIIKVFENRINLVRFLSVVSFVVFFVLVGLLVSIEENSLLHYKGELAVCVYTTFLLLGVVFEILHYLYIPIQAPNNSFSSTPQ